MKPLYFTLLVSLLLISSCDVYDWSQNRIIASADIIDESRTIVDYSQVKVCCSIQVEIEQANDYRMDISGPDNVLPYLLTEISADQLRIGFENGYNFDMRGKRVQINISMPTLSGIHSSSSSDVIVRDDFVGQNLELKASSSGEIAMSGFQGNDLNATASSSGDIKLNFRGSDIQAESSSSGRIQISGQAQSFRGSCSSSGKVLAADCPVDRADVSVSSSGKIELHVKEELKAVARSSGDIYYRGNPTQLNTDAASSGKVKSIQ